VPLRLVGSEMCIRDRLYREIRALRIYEGATEVQQLIIGRDLLK
jgi:acyl-CoA dehydrogenase